MKKGTRIKKAPLNKRVFAYIVDWYFCWVFCALPVCWLWNVMTKKTAINTDITLFPKPYGIVAGLLGILFGTIYYYVVPLKMGGQTLGKKFLSLKIVDKNGVVLSAANLAKRQILGVMILESSFMITGDYVARIISMFTFDIVGKVINYVMLVTFLVSCYMLFKKGTTIHDNFGHSMVVEK